MTVKTLTCLLVGFSLALLAPLSASAAAITQSFDLTASAPGGEILDGLTARAIFAWDVAAPSTLTITLKNISTGATAGTDAASQILTALSFDLGLAGAVAGDPAITGGSVAVGPGGFSVNFATPVAAGGDVSGEWGFGNGGATSMLPNLVSAMAAHTTPFGGANLDGTSGLDGPQGGLVTNPSVVGMGGMGAISDSVVIRLTLDKPLADLSFLANGVRAEFGSDYRFTQVPEPATVSVLVLGALAALIRRRRR